MDRQQFEHLVVEHLAAALRLAVRLTGDAHAAEEVVQEAMLRATKSWRQFQMKSSFRTWLFRIVINCFRDGLRKRGERWEEEIDAPESDSSGPRQVAESNELSVAVAKEVSALPPRQREVLVLIVYEQMSPAKAAQLLDTSEQNIRTTLHLGREKLRSRLKAFLPERML